MRIMNGNSNGIFNDLNRDETISAFNLCEGKVLLGMYVKSYGFYIGISLQVKARYEML